MGAVVFTVAAAALVATGVLLATTMQLRGSAFALGVHILAWGELILLTEGLSLIDSVGRAGYLVGEAVLLAISAAVWWRRGMPGPDLPRLRWPSGGVRQHQELALLAAVVVAAIAYQAFLVVVTPPNNYDSLAYHLTRAVAWLQQRHVGYFDAATARANAFPPNGEIGILYTLALLGRDRLAALPQLLAELAVLVAVYGIARRIGFSRAAALFAALLTATLSEFALESVTTQNDLVVASFVAAGVFFVVDRSRRVLPLAGLAIALAAGTKLTGLIALPVVALAALVLLPRVRVAELAACTAIAFVGFGAFTYVENVARTGHVLGVVPEAVPYRAQPSAGGAASTAARVYWRFVDFSGLDPPTAVDNGVANVGKEIFAAARIAPNPPGATATPFTFWPANASSEDTSYFGVLGFLLVVPLSFGFLAAWLMRLVPRSWGALAAALPLFVLAIALTQRYDHWLGRFMLIPVGLTMPLAAFLYDRKLRLVTTLAVGLGAYGLLATHLHNRAKPVGLDGSPAVWQLSRTEAQGLLAGTLPRAVPEIDRRVPADATIGAVLQNNDPAYLLYGAELKRHLVLLHARDVEQEAARRQLRWIVVRTADRAATTPGWCREQLPNGWQLLARRDEARGGGACSRL